MIRRARVDLLRRGLSRPLGRCLVAVVLVASLALEFIPCAGPCTLGEPAPGTPPCLMKLRVCGGAAHAAGSLADQSILRSEPLVLLPPKLVPGELNQAAASLSEGYSPPVYRPPRPAA